MIKKILLIALLAQLSLFAHAQLVLKPDSSGLKLRDMYLAMQVEKLWLNGVHVDWLSGEPDQTDASVENTTHCSAFVPAACYEMGIYLLRPPEHAQELLANAQFRWLFSAEAKTLGWRIISGTNIFEKAQRAANKGYMVLATYKNPNPERAGHIVCIMPATISLQGLASEGPRIIQSGRVNSSNMSFREAFKRVLNGWPGTNVLFFYNEKRIR